MEKEILLVGIWRERERERRGKEEKAKREGSLREGEDEKGQPRDCLRETKGYRKR